MIQMLSSYKNENEVYEVESEYGKFVFRFHDKVYKVLNYEYSLKLDEKFGEKNIYVVVELPDKFALISEITIVVDMNADFTIMGGDTIGDILSKKHKYLKKAVTDWCLENKGLIQKKITEYISDLYYALCEMRNDHMDIVSNINQRIDNLCYPCFKRTDDINK